MMKYSITLLAITYSLSAADIPLKVPYDNGQLANGQEYKLKLTDAVPVQVFATKDVAKDEKLVISWIKGKQDQVEVIVRDSTGKRLSDWRKASDGNAGIISVKGDPAGMSLYVIKTIAGDVQIRYLVSKLSKAQIDAINKQLGITEDE